MQTGDLLKPNHDLQGYGMIILLDELSFEDIEKENIEALVKGGYYEDGFPTDDWEADLGKHRLIYSMKTNNKIVLPEEWLLLNYSVCSTTSIPANA